VLGVREGRWMNSKISRRFGARIRPRKLGLRRWLQRLKGTRHTPVQDPGLVAHYSFNEGAGTLRF
jgi:hypothetical protein